MIDSKNLVNREIYRIQSRNLVVGVWDASNQGFIGVRHKFGDTYLFTEFEYDLQHGTAKAIESLHIKINENVPLNRHDSKLLRILLPYDYYFNEEGTEGWNGKERWIESSSS